MDSKDAEKIVNIMISTDGECRICASDLLVKLSKAFPEHKVLCEKLFKDRFDYELKDEN